MNEYEWQIYTWTGVVKARDMTSAMAKAIKTWRKKIAYPPSKTVRIDLWVKKIKK